MDYNYLTRMKSFKLTNELDQLLNAHNMNKNSFPSDENHNKDSSPEQNEDTFKQVYNFIPALQKNTSEMVAEQTDWVPSFANIL